MTKHGTDNLTVGASPALVSLDPTGVPGLDDVLGGGIQRGSLTIIAGPPGGGKTILAHHIAFSSARAGRRTTVLTAFSEPTNKLIAHMRPFAFFDENVVGQTLDVLSVQQLLRHGMDTAANEIVGTVRAANAELVILDGFRGVREMAEQPNEARQFIYDVSNRLSLLGTTLLLTSEAYVRDVAFFPEATTADVLLGLEFETIGARERRTLEVLKVRGAAPLSGRHAVTIGDEGVKIYPRIEARVARAPHLAGISESHMPRLASSGVSPAEGSAGDASVMLAGTGIPGLDPLLGGGLTPGSASLVVGERGVGKTLLAMQFALAAVRAGERCLFVSFRETTEQLVRKAAPFRWGADLADAVTSGALTVLRTPPVELRADVLADTLLALQDETHARRLVVDDVGVLVGELVASGYNNRFRDFIAALLESLRLRGVTTLLTNEVESARQPEPAAIPALNVLWLRRRLRGARFDRSLIVMHSEVATLLPARHPLIIQPPEGFVVASDATKQGEHMGNTWQTENEELPDDHR